MNFFQHQERARRKTKWLVLLFLLAVALINFAVYAAIQLIVFFGAPEEFHSFWDPLVFVGVSVVVVLIIGGASLGKTLSLRSGGSKVAEALGGTVVSPNTHDQHERRLLNVVEEMAIASGVPMPEVYVLEQEPGINAFAAGFTPNRAAIAVTRGTLQKLSRDELQGVVAHEFSHILNGDMRMNIYLIGVLFGILLLGLIGRIMMRVRGRKSGGIVLAGVLIALIGYIGTFIGRIIQAAVSRQREFLADSSAVQFTRNPAGIGGALKRIAGYEAGSKLLTPKAEQASHMFFSQGVTTFFSALLATHPPLDERIRRIEPTFAAPAAGTPAAVPAGEARAAGFAPAAAPASATAPATIAAAPAAVVEQAGTLSGAHLEYGATLLASLPQPLRDAANRPDDAVRLIWALLFDDEEDVRRVQFEALQRQATAEDLAAATAFAAPIRQMDARARLPLADLATPALRQLTPENRQKFLAQIETLIAVDGRVTLFEFALQWVLQQRLRRTDRPPNVRYGAAKKVRDEIAILVGAVAHGGNPQDGAAALAAFSAGLARVPDLAQDAPKLFPKEMPRFERLGNALERLAMASFAVKQEVIDAAAHTAFADRTVTLEEAELLRMIAVSLDCPLPPFLPEPAAAA
jgi:Zn-dependent protease with chaperone function